MWLEREEILWKQRSRVMCLKEGDKNSKFFHARASYRRRQKNITTLQNNDGVWLEGALLGEHIENYFASLFLTSEERGSMEFLETIKMRLSEQMEVDLSRDYTLEEIEWALKQMHPTKAPGPNTMFTHFYQKYWSTVGPMVSKAVLRALNSCQIFTELNHTFVTLFPRKNSQPKPWIFYP